MKSMPRLDDRNISVGGKVFQKKKKIPITCRTKYDQRSSCEYLHKLLAPISVCSCEKYDRCQILVR